MVFFFFFFKQKTAYEMLSGDWSSDVCSSDLLVVAGAQGEALAVVAGRARERATIGDWVVVDARGAVSARLPRHGVLARAGQDLAANVDVAFVVTSANRDLNPRRLERFVAVAAAGGCAPVLV